MYIIISTEKMLLHFGRCTHLNHLDRCRPTFSRYLVTIIVLVPWPWGIINKSRVQFLQSSVIFTIKVPESALGEANWVIWVKTQQQNWRTRKGPRHNSGPPGADYNTFYPFNTVNIPLKEVHGDKMIISRHLPSVCTMKTLDRRWAEIWSREWWESRS